VNGDPGLKSSCHDTVVLYPVTLTISKALMTVTQPFRLLMNKRCFALVEHTGSCTPKSFRSRLFRQAIRTSKLLTTKKRDPR
jgi:hypothetical protein